MLDDCITKLQRLNRHCSNVNEMTTDMHLEYENALIELLQHAIIENRKAVTTIKKLQHELDLARTGLKAVLGQVDN